MNTEVTVKENWYTRKPAESALIATALLSLLLFTTGYIFLLGVFNSYQWMPASRDLVFGDHQIWRLWTTLFAHGDLEHLLNNSLMFVPLAYFLTSYFGFYLFPILGIFIGGLINLAVLKTMPLDTSLIGMSGVVYWMGAVWLTLFVLIDSRKSIKRRFSVALFLSILLFAPQVYKQEVSYLSHLLGYISGIISGGLYYLVRRKEFLKAEVKEVVIDDPLFVQDGAQHPELAISKAQSQL